MALLQEMVHKVHTATGSRIWRYWIALMAVALLALVYDLRCYRNLSSAEAMDSAQVGRNIADGKGYTTLFVRPFSMSLVRQANQDNSAPSSDSKMTDNARIKGMHPDIANPPVYPTVLAGLMKTLPFRYEVNFTSRFWSVADARFMQSGGRKFWRYQPDFLITLFNQCLFVAIIIVTFFWARRLFDQAVAWASAVLLVGVELLWRFSVSGLSTLLLMLVFMGLVWCLTLFEVESRESKHGPRTLVVISAAAGAIVGLGGLTRYAFVWLLLPVLIFLVIFGGPRRATLCLAALAACAILMGPWIARNYQVSGTPFGTATFAALGNTGLFPEHRLERSLNPDLHLIKAMFWTVGNKAVGNGQTVFQEFFKSMGGGWIAGFFFAGLLIGFRHPGAQRLRYFTLAALALFIVVQAIGRTQLSEDSPEINSENLVVLLVPLVAVFGASFFLTLLDQIALPAPALRYLVAGMFGIIVWIPLILAFLQPQAAPVVYPPYYPPQIQQFANWMKEDELMMSDIPWAVAWYGHRQCVWTTLDATPTPGDTTLRENFFTINDYDKAIHALYLTRKTIDGRLLTDCLRPGETGWGNFVLNALVKQQVPTDFPLHQMPRGFLPESLFLSDWRRWRPGE